MICFNWIILLFQLNLDPQGKTFPGTNDKPHMHDNTADARNITHINISKSKQGENFTFETDSLQIVQRQTICLKVINWNYNSLD